MRWYIAPKYNLNLVAIKYAHDLVISCYPSPQFCVFAHSASTI